MVDLTNKNLDKSSADVLRKKFGEDFSKAIDGINQPEDSTTKLKKLLGDDFGQYKEGNISMRKKHKSVGKITKLRFMDNSPEPSPRQIVSAGSTGGQLETTKFSKSAEEKPLDKPSSQNPFFGKIMRHKRRNSAQPDAHSESNSESDTSKSSSGMFTYCLFFGLVCFSLQKP